ncbi:MAG: virulence RhuM family protein [Planctomycetota bacterium]
MDDSASPVPCGEVVVYEAPDGRVQVDARLERETVWLSLNQIAELFGRDKSVISRHLRNVFQSGELERQEVVVENATTAADGKTYRVEFFNLDAILSVGYRVNSKRGTQFRIWATRALRDHLLRGYTLNARRLAEKGLRHPIVPSGPLTFEDARPAVAGLRTALAGWGREPAIPPDQGPPLR